MNIPGPEEKRTAIFLRKAKWMLITVLMPELVIYVAWKQGQDAKALKFKLEEALEKHHVGQSRTFSFRFYMLNFEKSKSGEKDSRIPRPQISILYCHFVNMGGLVVDVASIHNTIKKVVITPNCLVSLTKLGHFIHVSDQQIRDLDRWDTLGKSIAIMQAFWIIVQCIGRRGAGLPISLLELNTCVNVGFAFCLRLLWNEKPFDIQSPIVADDKAFRGVTALMLMQTNFASPWSLRESVYLCVYRPVPLPHQGPVTDVSSESQQHKVNPLGSRIAYDCDNGLENIELVTSTSLPYTHNDLSLPPPSFSPDVVEDALNMSATNGGEDPRSPSQTSRTEQVNEPVAQPQQAGFKIITYLSQLPTPIICCDSVRVPSAIKVFCTLTPGQGLESGLGPRPNEFRKDSVIELSKNDVERWNLAASAWNTRKADSEDAMFHRVKIALHDNSEFEAYEIGAYFHHIFTTRAVNIEFWDPDEEEAFREFFDTLALLGLKSGLLTLLALFLALHGGIHLSAWKFSFPTHCEKLLWRLSCFGLILGFAPIALAAWVSRFVHNGDESPLWAFGRKSRWYYRPILVCFVTTFMAVICVTSISSMYLILESFLSLRHEPVGVFAKLQWAAFLPSLG